MKIDVFFENKIFKFFIEFLNGIFNFLKNIVLVLVLIVLSLGILRVVTHYHMLFIDCYFLQSKKRCDLMNIKIKRDWFELKETYKITLESVEDLYDEFLSEPTELE